jgi:hypothetical protein
MGASNSANRSVTGARSPLERSRVRVRATSQSGDDGSVWEKQGGRGGQEEVIEKGQGMMRVMEDGWFKAGV